MSEVKKEWLLCEAILFGRPCTSVQVPQGGSMRRPIRSVLTIAILAGGLGACSASSPEKGTGDGTGGGSAPGASGGTGPAGTGGSPTTSGSGGASAVGGTSGAVGTIG